MDNYELKKAFVIAVKAVYEDCKKNVAGWDTMDKGVKAAHIQIKTELSRPVVDRALKANNISL